MPLVLAAGGAAGEVGGHPGDRALGISRPASSVSTYSSRRSKHSSQVTSGPLASMAEIAGDDWCPEYAAAWAAAYGIISATMFEGAASADALAA